MHEFYNNQIIDLRMIPLYQVTSTFPWFIVVSILVGDDYPLRSNECPVHCREYLVRDFIPFTYSIISPFNTKWDQLYT